MSNRNIINSNFQQIANVDANLNVVGLDLPNIANFHIPGGNAGQVISTDGNGNLSWANGGSGGGEPIANAYLAATLPAGFPDPNRTQTTIAFTNANRTFSIAPTGANFTFWANGTQYTKTTAQTVTIPNTSGLYYIYFDSAGNLQQSTTFAGFNGQTAMTSVVYWNATANAQMLLADERHNVAMDYATGSFIHNTIGASYGSGYTISGNVSGNGNNATDAQIGVQSGVFYDQDLRFSTPAYTLPAQIPVLYRSGSGYVKDAATNFPYKLATNTAGYNLNTAGNWSVADLTTNAANKIGIYWLVVTNDIMTPLVSIMGQAQYNTLGQAEAANFSDLDLTGLPLNEFRVLYKLIIDASTNFTNAVRAKQVEFQDWRVTPIAAPISVNAIDLDFRETPATVFATDSIANTAWYNYVSNVSLMANGNSNVSIATANGNVTFSANGTANLVTITGAVGNANLDNSFIIATNTRANLGLIENLRLQSNLYGNSGVGVISNAPAGAALQFNGTNWEFQSVLNYQQGVALATTQSLNVIAYNNGSSGVGATLQLGIGVLVIDGVTISTTGTRILVKDQTANAFQNGVYNVTLVGNATTSTVLTRSTDYDQPTEMLGRDVFYVTSGTINGNASFIQLNTIVTVGTTPLVFESAGLATLQTVTSAGGTSNANIALSGANVSLGNVSNLKIIGGSSGQILTTDGNGNLTWTSAGSGSSISNGNSNVTVDANANIRISSNGIANVVTILALSNTQSTATFVGNVVASNFVGQLANGNSNIAIDANSLIKFSANGTANILVIRGNGLDISCPVSATFGVGNVSNPNSYFQFTSLGVANFAFQKDVNVYANSNMIFTQLFTNSFTMDFQSGLNGAIRFFSGTNSYISMTGGTNSYVDIATGGNSNMSIRASNGLSLTTTANLNVTSNFGNLNLTANGNGNIYFSANATSNLVIIRGNVGNANLDNSFVITTNTRANLGLIENWIVQSNVTGNSGQGTISNASPGSAIIYNGSNWEFSPVLNYQNGVALATTTNLVATYDNGTAGVGARLTAISGGNLTIDGNVNPAVGTRILVKDQTNTTTNGVYTVTTTGGTGITWVLTRATDYDTPQEALGRDVFYVTSGAINGNASFIQLNAVVAFGTTALVFESAGLATLQTVSTAASPTVQANYISNLNATASNVGAFVIGGNSSNTQITTAIGNGNIFTGGYIQIGNSADSANTLQIIAKTSNINGTLSGYNMLFAGANSPDTRFVTANSTAAVWTMGYASQAGTLFFPGIQFRSPVTSVAPARILVTPGGGVSNTDLRIESAGTGNIVLLGNTTIGDTTGNMALFAGNGTNAASGTISFTAGTATQALVSAGANRTPYWDYPGANVTHIRTTATSGNVSGAFQVTATTNGNMTVGLNRCNVSISGGTVIIPAGQYIIQVSHQLQPYNANAYVYSGFSTSNTAITTIGYGNGAVGSFTISAGATQGSGDFVTSTYTGYANLTANTNFFWWGFTSANTRTGGNSLITITRI